MKSSKIGSLGIGGFVLAVQVLATSALLVPATAHDDVHGRPHFKGTRASPTAVMRALAADAQAAQTLAQVSNVSCIGGMADIYPCNNVDLLAFLPLADIGGGGQFASANDIWGWTDSTSGREFALVGRYDGTAFVEITTSTNPVYLGKLATHTGTSSWRDIKTYADHAFIVSEASGHGMQVFDLSKLVAADPAAAPHVFTADAQYSGFGDAHNLVINEDSGFAYAVGTATCAGGLHMVNISTPTNPTDAGCFSADGYTHDAQCIIYDGPDTTYQGREICFNGNEDTLTIVDVTNKASPVQISRTGYPGDGYTHQGWVTPDHTYFLLDDELDETSFGHDTRTRVFDVSDLSAPTVAGAFDNTTAAIDHNQYVKGNHVYQANYRAGLRILEINDAATADLSEVGYFDIYPANDSANFNGAWSTYPYFPSGVVVVSGIEQGLFVLRPNLAPPTGEAPLAPVIDSIANNGDGTALITYSDNSDNETGFELQREKAHKKHGWTNTTTINLAADSNSYTDDSGKGTFQYRMRAVNAVGASAWIDWVEVDITSSGGGGGGKPPKCHPRDTGCTN